MNRLFDRLNLQPQERRLVVLVGTLVFFLLNMWFVWPHFSEWSRVSNQLRSQRITLQQYQQQINQIPKLKRQLKELESTGTAITSELQPSTMRSTILSLARSNRVEVENLGAIREVSAGVNETNRFFKQLEVHLDAKADEPQLVDFLYDLGRHSSMVRVRSLVLEPEKTNLFAKMNLVASYKKNGGSSAGATNEVTKTAQKAQ